MRRFYRHDDFRANERDFPTFSSFLKENEESNRPPRRMNRTTKRDTIMTRMKVIKAINLLDSIVGDLDPLQVNSYIKPSVERLSDLVGDLK